MSDQRRVIPSALMLLAAVILAAPEGFAATVHFVSGEVTQPSGLTEQTELGLGDTVVTGSDGIVIIEYRWRSEFENHDCQQLEIVGFGGRHTVTNLETPGRCSPQQARLPTPGSGPFASRDVRYGDAKMDTGSVPARVSQSRAAAGRLDQWIQTAERSFAGRAERVSNSRITVSGNGATRDFRLASGALGGRQPAAVRGKDVAVTWRMGNLGPEATRITLTEAVTPNPPMRPSPPIVNPGNGRAPFAESEARRLREEMRRREAAAAEEAEAADASVSRIARWFCKIDLHQGDTGELTILRAGERLKGEMIVRDGRVETPIVGSWTDDSITFTRVLSESSQQPFAGVVVRSGARSLAMGGRFANAYSGVWSADCAPDN